MVARELINKMVKYITLGNELNEEGMEIKISGIKDKDGNKIDSIVNFTDFQMIINDYFVT